MKTYFKLLLLFVLFFAIGHPRAVAEDITICGGDGTTTNGYVPFWAEYQASTNRTAQMIYPKSLITIPGGSSIKSITFYAYSVSNLANTTLSLGETSETTVTNNHLKNRDYGLTQVYSGSLACSNNRVTITFSTPYTWNGENLVIQTFAASSASDHSPVLWYGKDNAGSSGAYRYKSGSSGGDTYSGISNFLPKITIEYESSANIPTASVSPESLTFTDVQAGYSATQSITITNTSNNGLSLVPSLAITGTDAGLFSVGTSELRTLAPGEYVVVPVTYSPTTANQNHTAILTLTYVTPGENPVSGQPIEVSLTGSSVTPQYALTATPAEGTVNFGTVIVDGNPARFVTKKVSITNVGTSQWSIPTSNIVTTGDAAFVTTGDANIVTTGDAAFAITPNQSTTVVEPGGELSFTITFTPTEDEVKNYEGTLSITPFDGRTVTWFLMGEGSNAEPTLFDNLTYKWPFNADESKQTTSYMSEIATDPDQMIALCRAVYMNKDIPGNWYRGYTSAGQTEENVSYPAVGILEKDGNNYTYNDAYGWNIPMHNSVKSHTGEESGVTYTYMDPEEYKPAVDGVTLLMVEYKDGVLTSSSTSHSTSDYASLRSLFANTFKSVRVITQKKEIEKDGKRESTLFKIDADKLNRFFFLGKGRLRRGDFSVQKSGDDVGFYYGECVEPSFNTKTNKYTASAIGSGPFYEMFEQFSPVDLSASADVVDVYQAMVNDLQSYYVNHDCQQIPYVEDGHEFNMYGKTSLSDDCQDVRDLMFLVPEKRMTWWYTSSEARDKASSTEGSKGPDMFVNYYKENRPTMGLFSIYQEPIKGEKKDNDDVYQLTLSWHSNLLNFLPEGSYKIYQVINENGVETYVPVLGSDGNPVTISATKKSDKNETYQYVEIPMLEHGQQVTFVIQAVDNSGFLTMQMSNKQSYIIPGTNPAEMLQLTLTETNSRFDPQAEKNFYSNGLQLNAYDNQFKSEYITTGTEFTLWRTARTPQRDEQGNIKEDEDGNIVYDEVETQIGTATVAANNNITITINGDQTLESEFPTGESNVTHIAAGYNTNPGSATYTVNNDGYVQFNNFNFYDNFQASTASNNHPTEYVYKVKLTTAEPLNGLPNCVTWQEGKTFVYFEAYTNWTNVCAWAYNTNLNDKNYTGGTWPGTEMEKVGNNGTNYVYRWAIPQGEDSPNKIIFNWLDGDTRNQTPGDDGALTFTNGGYYRTSGLVGTITEDNTSNEAESNTAHVFIPKTKMEMAGVMSLAQVNADGVDGYKKAAQLPDGKEFTVDVKYASRAEVLRYDVYRWNMDETDHRYIIDEVKADGSEEDIAPNGEADNGQGNGLYTLKMNGNALPSVTVAQGETAAASFVDDYVRSNAGDWVYAPVVETFGADGNYNTYGAPIKSTVSGTVEIEVNQADMVQSKHTWKLGNDTYTYYYVPVTIKNVEVPDGYNIYKVRGWRLVDENLLGEELQGQTTEDGTQLPDRRARLKDDYLFEELDFGDDMGKGDNGMSKTSLVNYLLGSRPRPNGQIKDGKSIESMATFGGKKLSDGETIDAKFYVRIYFTPEVNPAVVETAPSQGAPRRADTSLTPADFDYYVAEGECEVELTSGIITGVNNVNVNRDIQSVTYVNPMGQVSSRPFRGVNIIVTRYSDGTSTTRKAIH